MANISQFHGETKKCHCGIADNPIIGSDKGCVHCKNRGFLASCKACDGTGSFVAQMAAQDLCRQSVFHAEAQVPSA